MGTDVPSRAIASRNQAATIPCKSLLGATLPLGLTGVALDGTLVARNATASRPHCERLEPETVALMPDLRKKDQLPIRLTTDERRRAERAARLESRRLKKLVTATEVLREGGTRYVDEILAAAGRVAA